MSLIYTVMVCLVSLIFVQFLLLTVALEGYLGGRIEWHCPRRWCLASALRHTGYSGIFSCRVGADHRHPNLPYRGGWDALTPTVIHAQEPERGVQRLLDVGSSKRFGAAHGDRRRHITPPTPPHSSTERIGLCSPVARY